MRSSAARARKGLGTCAWATPRAHRQVDREQRGRPLARNLVQSHGHRDVAADRAGNVRGELERRTRADAARVGHGAEHGRQRLGHVDGPCLLQHLLDGPRERLCRARRRKVLLGVPSGEPVVLVCHHLNALAFSIGTRRAPEDIVAVPGGAEHSASRRARLRLHVLVVPEPRGDRVAWEQGALRARSPRRGCQRGGRRGGSGGAG